MARHRVLVAYATKHGSTKEVATTIAATLREHDFDADLREASEVDVLAGYDAVVLGGSLYMGRWHAHARSFLEHHRAALRALPLGVFAMGPQDLSNGKVAESRAALDRALKHAGDVEPTAVAIFGGVVDPAKLSFPFNRMQPIDARDWEAIQGWTEDFCAAVEGRLLIEP